CARPRRNVPADRRSDRDYCGKPPRRAAGSPRAARARARSGGRRFASRSRRANAASPRAPARGAEFRDSLAPHPRGGLLDGVAARARRPDLRRAPALLRVTLSSRGGTRVKPRTYRTRAVHVHSIHGAPWTVLIMRIVGDDWIAAERSLI